MTPSQSQIEQACARAREEPSPWPTTEAHDKIARQFREGELREFDYACGYHDALLAAATEREAMRSALENLLTMYVRMVNSGDYGNWDPETEAEVIAARAALILPTHPHPESEAR